LSDAAGNKEFLKDGSGNVVKSRLNEDILKQIAITTAGTYVRSSGAEFGLDLIYEDKIAKMEKREIKAKMEKRYHERFQWPLGLGVLLLLASTIIRTRKE